VHNLTHVSDVTNEGFRYKIFITHTVGRSVGSSDLASRLIHQACWAGLNRTRVLGVLRRNCIRGGVVSLATSQLTNW